MAVEHPAARRVVGRAQPPAAARTRSTVPVYLGCDWDNVPLHLPVDVPAFDALTNSPQCRMGMLGETA